MPSVAAEPQPTVRTPAGSERLIRLLNTAFFPSRDKVLARKQNRTSGPLGYTEDGLRRTGQGYGAGRGQGQATRVSPERVKCDSQGEAGLSWAIHPPPNCGPARGERMGRAQQRLNWDLIACKIARDGSALIFPC